MPEIKNSFIQGKMNKDLDERLIPNGQYRDALNVEVSTSEGSDVGVVQNVLGNKRVESLVGDNFKCVGSIADEKTNKLYWFISKYDKDVILEYDANNDIANYIFVDTKAGTEDAVLKFFGNIITGINIIDNLLFWTDNQGEPKRINIDTCREGTTDIDTHTKLSFENGSFDGITISVVAPTDGYGNNEKPYFDGRNPQQKGRWVFVEKEQLRALLGNKASSGTYHNIRHYRDGKFLGVKSILLDHYARFRAEFPLGYDDPNYGYSFYQGGDELIWQVGDIIFGDDVKKEVEEHHVTVIRPKPLNAPTVKINHSENAENTSKIPNLFETKFPRFSYRYKYRDGEFSAFAPFTEPVFNAKYTVDTSKSIDGNVLYNQDTAYDIKEPYNKAMVNAIHSIELTNFITQQTPEDVVEIDMLYKQEDSSVIYSIGTIKHVDPEWHAMSNHEGFGKLLGTGKHPNATGGSWYLWGSKTKGKYTVTTENIYAALPANQLLRPWDNVPRKALAQEVTGNRIVYGNYLQNYDIGSKPQVQVSYNDRKNRLGTFDSKGLPSIKSQRNYQLGVVYCDKYGRETPVFTSRGGAINIPWQDSSGKKNASKSTQLNVGAVNNFPEWVDSLKFFIKENSNEYYNLTMDRAWVTKSTYELDNSEGHIWISFPSSDRNKISEQDYIILKKKIGVGEEQVTFENKFKVIDIKNEAPDAIKYELVNWGVAVNTNSFFVTASEKLFDQPDFRIDKSGIDVIHIDYTAWKGGNSSYRVPLEDVDSGADADELPLKTKDLYASWHLDDSNGNRQSSSKYKIIGGAKYSSDYILNFERKITEKDAAIAYNDGTTMPSGLVFQIEKKELKDNENFSGKFFVKISKNQVSSIVETGKELTNLDKYQVTAKYSCWNWRDGKVTQGGDAKVSSSSYGNINMFGTAPWHGGDTPNTNSITHVDNNEFGYLKVTDYAVPWQGILNKLGANGHAQKRFFIDAMYMTAGQSETSDYAKYCCITWSGTRPKPEVLAAGGGPVLYPWPEKSAWSYPPLKTWLSEFGDTTSLIIPESEAVIDAGTEEEFTQVIPAESVWYENNLISTSPVLNNNSDYSNLPVDGWVGPLQNVSRWTARSSGGSIHHGSASDAHINGLEAFVTTNSYHATGARRWFSGLNGTDHGVGNDTNTYSNSGEEGRHFMHLSFFAPGKDLHDGDWDNLEGGETLYGANSYAASLQGIWGGGVFTGEKPNDRFGTASQPENKHIHLAMEGNYDDNDDFLPEPAAPGVGYGYDLDYREAHERQWDPTFLHDENGDFIGDPGNLIRDFIRNLYPGSKFRFNRTYQSASSGVTALIDDAVYTIKKVTVKKLYNHTSWRKPYNRWASGYGYIHDDTINDFKYWPVEQAALAYLNQLDENGDFQGSNEHTNFRSKIEDFGKTHNRRLCYIIELDKNPRHGKLNLTTDSAMGNPTEYGNRSGMSAHFAGNDYMDIEFLDPVQDYLLSDLSKFPAIWEIDPKKQEVDLDIYYEASNNIPVRINEETNALFAPIGCKVEIINVSTSTPFTAGDDVTRFRDVYLTRWDGNVATFFPGFNRGDGANEIDYTNASFKFIRNDGSYTIAEAGGQQLIGEIEGYKTEFIFKEDVADVIGVGLNWYNCFSFGNGLESNRIRDDFNEMFISNGVKASTTTQETYEEERRSHGLIYSGVYNSNSGVNDLNQFIMAEKTTKDLNPTYGSIQKLFQRRISLIAFCEDRVISITSNKDAIYNADGTPQLISSSNVLGDANPFVGNYGISKNPESFASESYRAYFTDKARGAVLRLSKDGLTPISKSGMHDWFRDHLPVYTSLIGTYDSYKENYNLTLSNTYTENIIFNTYFQQGVDAEQIDASLLDVIQDGGVFSGNSYVPSFLERDVESNSTFDALTWHDNFKCKVKVVNHAAIPKGWYQPETSGTYVTAPDPVVAVATTVLENYVQETEFDFASYGYGSIPPGSGSFVTANLDGALETSGAHPGHFYRWYHATASRTFGTPRQYDTDSDIYCEVRRSWNGNVAIEEAYSGTAAQTNGNYVDVTPFGQPEWVPFGYAYFEETKMVGQALNANGNIIFDRVQTDTPTDTYVEFRHMGHNTSTNTLDGDLNSSWYAAKGITKPNNSHSKIFNGDEIEVTVKFKTYATSIVASSDNFWRTGSGGAITNGLYKRGYNFIKPFIQLRDGNNYIDSTYLRDPGASFQSSVPSAYNPYLYKQFNPGYSIPTDWQATSDPNAWHMDKGFQPSGYVEFPVTKNPTFSGTGSWYGQQQEYDFDQEYTYHTVTARFKFDDINQGAPYDSTTETVVVDELWVRVGNCYDDVGQDAASDNPNYLNKNKYPSGFEYPRFEIVDVRIDKLLGVKAPHTAYDGGNPGQYVTYYDDPETANIDESWTETEVQAQGTWDPTVNGGQGGYVLNYDEWAAGDYYSAWPTDAIPPAEVPAFVEIQHISNDNYNFIPGTTGITSNPGAQWLMLKQSNRFGINRPAITKTAYKVNPNTGNNTASDNGGLVTWYEPDSVENVWWTSQGPQTYPFNKTWDGNTYAPGSGSKGAQYGGGSIPKEEIYDNVTSGYWRLQTDPGVSGHFRLDWPMGAGNGYETGKWYLVDVELHDYYHPEVLTGGQQPDIPGDGGSGDGYIVLTGVAESNSNANNGTPVDDRGIGVFSGTSGQRHIRLVPQWRTEYGDNRWVLRAIYQVHPNSDALSYMDTFKLRFYNFHNPTFFKKIITRDITWTTDNGSADFWLRDYGSGTWDQHHTLTRSLVYLHSNKLCWDNAVDETTWTQYFGTATPNPTSNGWTLKFNVTANDKNNFDGELAVSVTNKIGDVLPNDFTGMHCRFIADMGTYEIKFTMDNDDSNWSIHNLSLPDTNNPNQPLDYSGIAQLQTYDDSGWGTDNPVSQNNIRFRNVYQGTNPLSMGVSGITLTNQETIFQGGTVNSWNFDGFEPTIDQYIIWHGSHSSSGRIQFTNCPISDPNSTSSTYALISANQLIDKPINRYEKYEISFVYKMESKEGNPGSGLLHMYYFNDEGYGFRINDIGHTDDPERVLPNYTPEAIYHGSGELARYYVKEVYGIGDGSSVTKMIGNHDLPDFDKASSEITYQGVEALRNTFVIRIDTTGSDFVTAWVDNISMKRVYDIELNDDGSLMFPETTLTFSEDVNGWTSFKSFVPESGLSLSKKYFTLKDAALYQHYVPLTYNAGNQQWVDSTVEDAENYNIFYGSYSPSTIKAVLNTEPSVVKMFNTLNYEGSQAHIINPIQNVDLDGNPIITPHNAGAWSLSDPANNIYPNIDGWKVAEIKTDMDGGSLKEFVKKEGKWFGYIKGKHIIASDLDTSRFSVQGIGIASNIVDATSTSTSTGGSAGGGNGGGNGGGGAGGGGY